MTRAEHQMEVEYNLLNKSTNKSVIFFLEKKMKNVNSSVTFIHLSTLNINNFYEIDDELKTKISETV